MAKTVRVLFAALGAFAFWTGVEIAWCLATPGDLFANGNPLVYPSYALALGAGAWAGWRSQARWTQGVIAVVAAGAVCYYLLMPPGWWATPPPGWDRAAKLQPG